MFAWRYAAGHATSFLYLLSIFGYSALKTYPGMTLTRPRSFTGNGKTTLNRCWPVQVLVSHSIPDFVHLSLHCLASLGICIFIFCFMCTTKEEENVPLQTESKDSFSLEKIIIRGFTKIRSGRVIQSSLDLFESGV